MQVSQIFKSTSVFPSPLPELPAALSPMQEGRNIYACPCTVAPREKTELKHGDAAGGGELPPCEERNFFNLCFRGWTPVIIYRDPGMRGIGDFACGDQQLTQLDRTWTERKARRNFRDAKHRTVNLNFLNKVLVFLLVNSFFMQCLFFSREALQDSTFHCCMKEPFESFFEPDDMIPEFRVVNPGILQ